MSPTLILESTDGITAYRELLRYVLMYGKERSPRGQKTLDAGCMTVVMTDTSHPLPLGLGRNVSRKIAAVEALQLVGRFSSPTLTVASSPNFQQFAEPDSGKFHGAYGNRIGTQLSQVAYKLKRDEDTRQAIITLWDPWLDNQPDKRDYPCTLMIQFAIIDDKLEMTVVMRSQDVWWGTPYDWFQFSQMQQTLATTLNIAPGQYRHTTLSTHIYEKYISPASNIASLTESPRNNEWQPLGFGRPWDTINAAIGRAHAIGLTGHVSNPTASEQWYMDIVNELTPPIIN